MKTISHAELDKATIKTLQAIEKLFNRDDLYSVVHLRLRDFIGLIGVFSSRIEGDVSYNQLDDIILKALCELKSSIEAKKES